MTDENPITTVCEGARHSLASEEVISSLTSAATKLQLNLKPDLQEIKGAEIAAVIEKLRKYNEAFYEAVFDDDAFLYTADQEKIKHACDILIRCQSIVDNLEPLALSQELGTEKVLARIVKAGNSNNSYTVPPGHEEEDNPPLLFKEGAPWLIAVANPEECSAYEQLAVIIKSAVAPLLEMDSKKHFIRNVILFGSVVYNPKQPGDIDLLVLYDDESSLPSTDIEPHLSKEAGNLLWELSEQQRMEMNGRNKIRFTLVGDTITTRHCLDITLVPVSDFLRRYYAVGDERQRLLNANKDAYKNLGMTFPEALVQTGGMIIYGEDIRDPENNIVLSKKDTDLLQK